VGVAAVAGPALGFVVAGVMAAVAKAMPTVGGALVAVGLVGSAVVGAGVGFLAFLIGGASETWALGLGAIPGGLTGAGSGPATALYLWLISRP
jgi:hypothetical protein